MIKTVTEFCSCCEREVNMQWDIDRDGYEAYCPYCGEKLMLCSECFEAGIVCDWGDDKCRCMEVKR